MISTSLARMLSLAAVAFSATSALGEIAWRENLQEAHAEATASGKPLLLHFYGDNCPWCDKLEAGAFTSPEVGQAIDQAVIPVKVHTGKNQNLVSMFEVKQIPTDVIVTPQGNILSRGTSKQKPADFVAVIAKAVQTARSPQPQMPPQTQVAAAPVAPTAPAPAAQAPMPGSPTMPGNPTMPSNLAMQGAPMMPGPTVAAAPAPTMPASVANPPLPQIPNYASQAPVAATAAAPPTAPGATAAAPAPAMSGGVPAQLAGARTDNLNVSAAAQTSPGVKPAGTAQPELALEGFCAVSLIDGGSWTEGKPQHGVIHLGKLYLFADATAMQKFLANPVPYTPVLNEIDVVRFFEDREIVPGKRDYGMSINNRMFFFADEEALNHFRDQWERYFDAAIDVMDTAIKEANPGA